ncbi:hypothetical protein Gotur_029245 [Gossypium turneri]
MASHLKGVQKSTLTDEMRKALCEYKNEHPSSSQKDLQQWIKNSNVKRLKSAKYPELEKVLYEWFLQYQEKAYDWRNDSNYSKRVSAENVW